MTKLNDKDQEWCDDNFIEGSDSVILDCYPADKVETKLIEKQTEIDELKSNELKSDLLVMCNARRLIKARKRTSNGRLASELFGMGCGSGRDYCRKLNLDPDSNETNYSDAINQLKDK